VNRDGHVDGYDVITQDGWVRKTSLPPAGIPVERTTTSTSGGSANDIKIVVDASLPGGTCTATQ